MWTGLGVGLAGMAGGLLYGSHGPAVLFTAAGSAILLATAAAAAVFGALRRRRKGRPEVLPSGESVEQLAALAGDD